MYKTGRPFSYLLFKESVANEGIACHCLLDQSFVNHASDELRRRLSACVDAEGAQLTDNL